MGKNGAPVGNRNAVKHGLYAKVVTEKEKLQMREAKGIEGLDDELALLRVKLCRLLEDNPDRIDLHLKVLDMIARLYRTCYATTPQDREKLSEEMGNVLEEVAIPLGLMKAP